MITLILIVVGIGTLVVARRYRVIGRRSTDIAALPQNGLAKPAGPTTYYHQVQA